MFAPTLARIAVMMRRMLTILMIIVEDVDGENGGHRWELTMLGKKDDDNARGNKEVKDDDDYDKVEEE
jgi:hypothetical protein